MDALYKNSHPDAIFNYPVFNASGDNSRLNLCLLSRVVADTRGPEHLIGFNYFEVG